MIVSRRVCRALKAPHISRRTLSVVSGTPYPPVVRALPFAFSEKEAVIRLGIAASARAITGSGFIRSVGARLLPSFGFQPLQPARIQAIYLPAWIIDAEVQADCWLSNETPGEPAKRQVAVSFTDSYMPGFTFDPLSRFAFRPEGGGLSRFVPWSKNLVHQCGSDVLCLPFTHTPFALVDAARSLSFAQATVSDTFRFDPSTVRANFFAAYPILIPVFLARYDAEDMLELSSFVAILEAHQPWQRSRFIIENMDPVRFRQMVDNSPAERPKIADVLLRLMAMQPGYRSTGGEELYFEQHFAHVEHVVPRPHVGTVSLDTWLNAAAVRDDALEAYRAAHFGDTGVDWDDMRVRAYTPAEWFLNQGWLHTRISRSLLEQGLAMADEHKRSLEHARETLQCMSGKDVVAEDVIRNRLAQGDRVLQQLDMSKRQESDSPFSEPVWFTEWARQTSHRKSESR